MNIHAITLLLYIKAFENPLLSAYIQLMTSLLLEYIALVQYHKSLHAPFWLHFSWTIILQ